MLAPCEAHEESRGEVIVRRRWCYKGEGIERKCTGFREQRGGNRERKNIERKRGINRNRKAGEEEGMFR